MRVALQKIWDQPPVRFDADCIAAVRRGAELSGFSARDMVSGAGHDAAYVSRVAPTAMIFVPCRGGISHNEAEFTSKEQCAAGAQVLLQAVLDYDRRLAERRRDDMMMRAHWRLPSPREAVGKSRAIILLSQKVAGVDRLKSIIDGDSGSADGG